MTISTVVRRLTDLGMRPQSLVGVSGYMAVCPVCKRLEPAQSLGVGEVHGVPYVQCWHGCPEPWIWKALGLSQPRLDGSGGDAPSLRRRLMPRLMP